ncbi:hypothetical protein SISSUDRAFT_984836 [Sistotremastrum suecicum HHB10207 ss-3]|uniref:ribonuclease Z n=1 Tax=Sistotremastrum suecicum HHB10207 ss-3 TaxID=1314776 RepID=A0A166ED28_9AGAM|nr:hypothetical protein SISSUDRAFT_984836 [Sistotremastrum suecicum HHB10207 ss-3]
MWQAIGLSQSTADSNPSILLTFDSGKYLFNCGEGTTRLLIQNRRGFRKVKGIFATRVNTDAVGGIPGTLMSLADSGTERIELCGPKGLLHFIASARFYTLRESLSVTVTEATAEHANEPIFKDDNVSIYAVTISPPTEDPPLPAATRKRSRSHSPISRNNSPSRRSPSPARKFSAQGSSKPSPVETAPSDFEAVFTPSRFQGEQAIAWRKLIVSRMFPGSKPPSAVQYDADAPSLDNPEQIFKPDVPTKNPVPDPFGLQKYVVMPNVMKGLPAHPRAQSATCYIVAAAPVRGKFDPVRAKSFGLKSGPLFGKLSRGESVTAPNGKVITPDMCMDRPEPSSVLFIIDCPSVEYIDSLTSSTQFEAWKNRPGYALHAIYHLLGEGVLEDPRYGNWMRAFGSEVHHIVDYKKWGGNPITYPSPALAQLRLSKLDSSIFPMLKFTPDSKLDLPIFSSMTANQIVSMRPRDAPRVDPIEAETIFRDALTAPEASYLDPPTLHAYEEAKQAVRESETGTTVTESPGKDVVIVTLGTASAAPTKYRNVSSTLVRIPGYGSLLLDGGEGTWGQLARHFGEDQSIENNVWDVLRDLKCIYISHAHGDHHMGISRILSRRRQLKPPVDQPLYLIGNYSIQQYLREYCQLEDLGLRNPNDVVFISPEPICMLPRQREHCRNLMFLLHAEPLSDLPVSSQQGLDAVRKVLGLETMHTIEVEHRIRCHGLYIKHESGWSLAYSGDTLPCDALVEGARGATILIHEATMADGQEQLAYRKAHSTFSQAIDVGKRMGAETILLTHFSGRYPKMPEYKTMGSEPTKHRLALAFDNAQFRVGDMWKMEKYFTAIERSYGDVDDETTVV